MEAIQGVGVSGTAPTDGSTTFSARKSSLGPVIAGPTKTSGENVEGIVQPNFGSCEWLSLGVEVGIDL